MDPSNNKSRYNVDVTTIAAARDDGELREEQDAQQGGRERERIGSLSLDNNHNNNNHKKKQKDNSDKNDDDDDNDNKKTSTNNNVYENAIEERNCTTATTPTNTMNNDGDADDDDDNYDDDDDDLYDTFTTIYDMIAVPCELLFAQMSTGTAVSSGTSLNATMPNDNKVTNTSQPQQRQKLSSCSFPRNNVKTATTTSATMNQKPILSRSEAQCLIQINLLAQKLDSLATIASKVIQQRIEYKHMMMSILSTKSVIRNFLIPLYILIQQQPCMQTVPTTTPTTFNPTSTDTTTTSSSSCNKIMKHISNESEMIINQFYVLVQQLKQYSEQNWNLASSLESTIVGYSTSFDHTTDPTTITKNPAYYLVQSKYQLSTIQNEICRRIERYVLLLSSSTSNDGNNHDEQNNVYEDDEELLSMNKYCQMIMPEIVQKNETSLESTSHTNNKKQAVVINDDMNIDDDDEMNRNEIDIDQHEENDGKQVLHSTIPSSTTKLGGLSQQSPYVVVDKTKQQQQQQKPQQPTPPPPSKRLRTTPTTTTDNHRHQQQQEQHQSPLVASPNRMDISTTLLTLKDQPSPVPSSTTTTIPMIQQRNTTTTNNNDLVILLDDDDEDEDEDEVVDLSQKDDDDNLLDNDKDDDDQDDDDDDDDDDNDTMQQQQQQQHRRHEHSPVLAATTGKENEGIIGGGSNGDSQSSSTSATTAAVLCRLTASQMDAVSVLNTLSSKM